MKRVENIAKEVAIVLLSIIVTDFLTEYLWHSNALLARYGTLIVMVIVFDFLCQIIQKLKKDAPPSLTLSFEEITKTQLSEIVEIKKRGELVKAVKRVRDIIGQGIKASKEFVDKL